jgi:hypothetical protein
MKTIDKHKLEITDEQTLRIKGFNGFLKVAEQNGYLFVWFLMNLNDSNIYTYRISVIGAGEPINKSGIHQGSHLDSVVMSDGRAWHVFVD